jgi:hypothetical protein
MEMSVAKVGRLHKPPHDDQTSSVCPVAWMSLHQGEGHPVNGEGPRISQTLEAAAKARLLTGQRVTLNDGAASGAFLGTSDTAPQHVQKAAESVPAEVRLTHLIIVQQVMACPAQD